jgi:AhpD family alkylhydroperoxidase
VALVIPRFEQKTIASQSEKMDREVNQMENLEEILVRRKKNRDRLEKEAPDLFNGFNELMRHYYKESALDLKQKELIAVGAAVATRCIPCLANHANNAFTHGATREEILDAAAIGVEFGGGPSFVAVRDNLLDFLDDIEG